MELDGKDSRAVRGTPADNFPVVVIGCGESGLLAGIRLKEAGIPFTIVEKNAGVGGTWWQNTYPGARVDVGNHFYCYSFEPTDQWTHFFAEQPELQAYFQTVMDKYDIGSHVLWETEVTEASWDDDTATWSVRARDRNGATTTLSARAVISAVGQLNRPHLPDIDGQQDFAGPAFHSSEWDHSVDLRGKRVAMIGAGASGFQIAPAIAGDVDRLTVFQRTAQWMFPNRQAVAMQYDSTMTTTAIYTRITQDATGEQPGSAASSRTAPHSPSTSDGMSWRTTTTTTSSPTTARPGPASRRCSLR